MIRDLRHRRTHLLPVSLLALVAAGWLARRLTTGLGMGWRVLRSGDPVGLGFDALLVWSCQVVGLVVLGWLVVLTVLTVRDLLAGRHERRRGCPLWLHRAVLAACGAGVVAGLGSAAQAQTTGPAATGVDATGVAAVLSGLPYPDRPVTSTTPPLRRAGTVDGEPHRYRIVAGDTLWDIGAATLPVGADDAAIDRRWRHVYAANADALGPDPDLIHPGTVLRLPGAPEQTRGEHP